MISRSNSRKSKLARISVALVAVLAFAGVATASAQAASPQLFTSGGAVVAPGTALRAVSSNLQFTGVEPAGNVECTRNTMAGPLKTNSGGEIVSEISSFTLTGEARPYEDCRTTLTFGGNSVSFGFSTNATPANPWCLKTTILGQWSLASCNGGTPTISYEVIEVPTGKVWGTCSYAASEPKVMSGKYNTGTSPLTLTVVNSSLTKTASTFTWCPAKYNLSGTFTLTNSSGGGLKIS
jgi:hypothetical protein